MARRITAIPLYREKEVWSRPWRIRCNIFGLDDMREAEGICDISD